VRQYGIAEVWEPRHHVSPEARLVHDSNVTPTHPCLARRAADRGALVATAALGLLLGALGARPADAQSWRATQGDVRVAVPLRPGGGFEAKTQGLKGTLTLAAADPVRFTGELELDLTTIDTGIQLRNQHLRENYLEVAKPGFDKAVLSDIRVGEARSETFEGRSGFAGTLKLHGVSKAIGGSAELKREAGGMRVTASFPLLLTDFGIEPPQYMGVGVGNRLSVKVTFLAAPAAR
jgi:polyisoprenoid-binding protein YceI